MSDERDLDRAIDAAAKAMMAGEPSRALQYSVMAQVRAGVEPTRRRFVWIAATASVAIWGVAIALMSLYRAPETLPSLPAARPFAVAQPATTVAPPNDLRPVRRVSPPQLARRAAAPAVVPPPDVSPIEPLEAEPITVAAIDVPLLERDAPASIEVLTIDELTIEPLAASND
jgi:hypothetical protein